MIGSLRQRVRAYLDEVIYEADEPGTGFHSKEWTRGDVIVYQTLIIAAALFLLSIVALIVAVLAWPSITAALWPYINAGLQFTWVKLLAVGILIGGGWLLFMVRTIRAYLDLRQRIRA